MPHPDFKRITDPYAAEVFSEVMEPGEYVHYSSSVGMSDTGVPLEPADLSSMTAAFISEQGAIKLLAVHGLSGDKRMATEGRLNRAYAADVGWLQGVARGVEPYAPALGMSRLDLWHPRQGRLGTWAVDAAIEGGKRLVAAHLVYTAEGGSGVYSSLAYPACAQHFPGLVERAVRPIVSMGEDELASEGISPEGREALVVFMDNVDSIRERLAGLPAATVLPTPTTFRDALKQYRLQSQRRKRS
jgi:hypothetical protein